MVGNPLSRGDKGVCQCFYARRVSLLLEICGALASEERAREKCLNFDLYD
jgi:hypothetical protein